MARIHFETDRKRYLITRALVRTVLSKYFNTSPADWQFLKNDYGKPFVANSNDLAQFLSFNVSHTRELVLLGLVSSGTIGVDVENTAIRPAPLNIVDKVLAPLEIAALQKLAVKDRDARFFQYWTLKESYIKARGVGLSLPLDQIAFNFEKNGTVTMSVHAALQEMADHWDFWQFQLESDHVMSICVERVSSIGRRVICRRIIPLVEEVSYELRFLTASPSVYNAVT